MNGTNRVEQLQTIIAVGRFAVVYDVRDEIISCKFVLHTRVLGNAIVKIDVAENISLILCRKIWCKLRDWKIDNRRILFDEKSILFETIVCNNEILGQTSQFETLLNILVVRFVLLARLAVVFLEQLAECNLRNDIMVELIAIQGCSLQTSRKIDLRMMSGK